MIPYERPTEELRQVLHRDNTFDHAQFWYTVQRRWMVQDGPVHESSETPLVHEWKAGLIHPLVMGRWIRVKPVWKELPCVTEEEARQ